MIQRWQSLWLFGCSLAAIGCFMFPFVTGKALEKGIEVDRTIKAGSDFLLLIVTGASLILSSVIIFLYKDRKLQIKLCLAGMLLAVLVLILFFSEKKQMTKSTLALSSILPFLNLAGYVMAFRYIRKDEKLVKSLDKLR